MVSRSHVAGAYVYPAVASPRQRADGGTVLTYDTNGNMTGDGARTLVWGEPTGLKR